MVDSKVSEVTEVTEVTEVSDVLKTSMEERTRLANEKYSLERELRELESKIKENESFIMKTCQHNWVRERGYFGPYEKPDDYCTICGSIRYRW